jgi:hypothetical protein
VKFETGISDFVACTCGKINFVPNTGKYKDLKDYERKNKKKLKVKEKKNKSFFSRIPNKIFNRK